MVWLLPFVCGICAFITFVIVQYSDMKILAALSAPDIPLTKDDS